MVTRSYNRIHFDDIAPERFEMMIMLIIYRMRRWERVDHLGVAGCDEGVDISAVELLENNKRNRHHFQCKRYNRITKVQIEKIVADYIAKNPQPADYYYLVCGCNPSTKAIEGFNKACEKAGIKHFSIWSASYIETMLYSDYHDILFAFFDINLTIDRENRISAIRRNLVLKKRMHVDFMKNNMSDQDLVAVREKGEYWRKFIHSEVLIRSIYDKSYPTIIDGLSGYFKAEIYNWYHNGLEVRAFPYIVNAKIRFHKEIGEIVFNNSEDYDVLECKLEVFGCLPFENIIDYDCNGDEYYRFPHLYCDYPCGSDPFEKIQYRMQDGQIVSDKDIIKLL